MTSSMMDSVSTINSVIRTFLALVVVGGVGVASWFGYSVYNESEIQKQELITARDELEKAKADLGQAQSDLEDKDKVISAQVVTISEKDSEIDSQKIVIEKKEQEIDDLHVVVEQKNKEIDKLDTALRLVKINHRVARLTVTDQQTDPDSGEVTSKVEFVELNDQGEEIDQPKEFLIQGDVVYVDSWVVKFEDKYIEQASDLDRSTSLVLFRRIFGEMQEPRDGFPVDKAGSAPKIYSAGEELSELEKKIWGDFWSVANDEVRQKELGIRAAHGDAPSIKVQNGKSYRVELRASDGLTIKPDDTPPPIRKPVG